MTYAITEDYASTRDPNYPHAPGQWSESEAQKLAREQGIELGPDHLAVIRSLQEYYFRHQDSGIKVRELTDALDEAFHQQGGLKHLYLLFPGGPIAQGCHFAGLQAPAGAVDKSFGSVQ